MSAFGGSFVTQYGYDTTSGRLDTLTYPSDPGTAPLRMRHHYDRGRLVPLSDADNANTTFWRADALGALGEVAAETLGNGVRVDSDWDAVTQRLHARTAGPGGGNSFQDLRFTWDVAGNLSSRQEGNLGVNEVFSYDSRDRLDFMTSSSGAFLDLAYDEIGNLTYKSDVGPYPYGAAKKPAVVRRREQLFVRRERRGGERQRHHDHFGQLRPSGAHHAPGRQLLLVRRPAGRARIRQLRARAVKRRDLIRAGWLTSG